MTMIREILAIISDIGGVVAFVAFLFPAVWAGYLWLKSKRLYIPPSNYSWHSRYMESSSTSYT